MPTPSEGHRVNDDAIEYHDDDCAGFALRLVRGNDGDFHVSLVPDRARLDRAAKILGHGVVTADDIPWYRVSVRVCTHAGGGRHARLYAALATLWREEGMYEGREGRV